MYSLNSPLVSTLWLQSTVKYNCNEPIDFNVNGLYCAIKYAKRMDLWLRVTAKYNWNEPIYFKVNELYCVIKYAKGMEMKLTTVFKF